jgi:RNA polymerase sigma-70 factor (ECF subfamily)
MLVDVATIVGSRAETGVDFDGFFRDEYRRLVGALYLLCRSVAEAEDISQEAMARVWERWERVRVMESPVGYVYRIALNLYRRRVRRATLLRQVRPMRAETGDLEAVEARSDLGRALRALPVAQREALVIHDYLGFGTEAAAGLLAIRPGAFRVRLHRARVAIRQQLGEVDE